MAQNVTSGIFVPTTNVWDVSQIYEIDVTSPQFKELLVRLYQNINNISVALNLKDSGYYITDSFVNSQLFFPNPVYNSGTAVSATYRQVFRIVINFGALPNGTINPVKTVPHGLTINNQYTFTRIYGTASDTTAFSYIPLPFASATGTDDIQLEVTATDVVVTVQAAIDRSNYNVTYIILEYITN